MFIDGVVIGILIALIMGGKFKYLLTINIRYSWLILFSFVIQYSTMFLFPKYLLPAIVISNIGLLSFCFLNSNQIGFKYVTTGILLNVLVMLANGGRMPVNPVAAKVLSPEDYPALMAGEYGKHLPVSSETHLNFLGDIFFLTYPYPRPIIISLGDIVITIGMISFLYYNMVIKGKEKKEVIEIEV